MTIPKFIDITGFFTMYKSPLGGRINVNQISSYGFATIEDEYIDNSITRVRCMAGVKIKMSNGDWGFKALADYSKDDPRDKDLQDKIRKEADEIVEKIGRAINDPEKFKLV